MAYYPLVGLIIGALLSALQVWSARVVPEIQAAILLVAWALLTGALHLDGLADSADAWLGAHGDRDKALRIMKDPASGPAGVTAIVLVLVLKFAALVAIAFESTWMALLFAPVLGRAAMVLVLLTTPYARADGLGAPHARFLARGPTLVALLVTAASMAFAGRAGWIALAVAAVLTAGLRRMMLRRLGGTTGDTLGATCEITEAGVLLAVAMA